MTADGVSGALILECVVNISEGRDRAVIGHVAAAGGPWVLDIHRDEHHHRTVLTLAGPASPVEEAVRAVATQAVATIDLRGHAGVHPRLGSLDVVPFVALGTRPAGSSAPAAHHLVDGDLTRAVQARDRCAAFVSGTLGVPCFRYGPRASGPPRTLPEIRRGAFDTLAPDDGPPRPHPHAGATAVGARPLLVAYNLFVADGDAALARAVAAAVRGPGVRALGLEVGGAAQVSCNLTDPFVIGPADAYDAVATRLEAAGAGVDRAELVGLLPAAVLAMIPTGRWAELDLSSAQTIEARLERNHRL